MSQTLQSMLRLDDLSLLVHLGWTSQERRLPQAVSVSIDINFHQIAPACQNDNLDHTLCYDQLTQQLVKRVSQQQFKLLEFLTQYIFDEVQKHLNDNDYLKVCVTKKPPMEHLEKVSFTLQNNL